MKDGSSDASESPSVQSRGKVANGPRQSSRWRFARSVSCGFVAAAACIGAVELQQRLWLAELPLMFMVGWAGCVAGSAVLARLLRVMRPDVRTLSWIAFPAAFAAYVGYNLWGEVVPWVASAALQTVIVIRFVGWPEEDVTSWISNWFE